jgi:hypothetical protein
MEAILVEQSFQQTGCTSDECLVEAGKLLGVQKMLAGSVGKFGTVYTIELRIIDVQSGKIEASATYDYRGEMEKLLLEGCTQAIGKVLLAYDKKSKISSFSHLQIITDVLDTDILLDSLARGQGKTPLLSVIPGLHQLRIDHDFYVPVFEELNLTAGDTLIKKYHMEKAWASLVLKGYPAQAAYTIADHQGTLSEAPTLKIAAGKHVLKVSAPYFYQQEKDIRISRGVKMPLDIRLTYGGDDLVQIQKRQKWLNVGSLTSLGLTLVSAVLARTFYDKYKQAQNSSDAADYKKLTQTFDTTTIVFAALTATISVATVWNWLKTSRLKKELNIP